LGQNLDKKFFFLTNKAKQLEIKERKGRKKLANAFINPLSAIVEFTNHLGFEPEVQGAEPPGVVHVEDDT